MRILKIHPFGNQPVDIGRFHPTDFVIVSRNRVEAHVISQNENNIRFLLRLSDGADREK